MYALYVSHKIVMVAIGDKTNECNKALAFQLLTMM